MTHYFFIESKLTKKERQITVFKYCKGRLDVVGIKTYFPASTRGNFSEAMDVICSKSNKYKNLPGKYFSNGWTDGRPYVYSMGFKKFVNFIIQDITPQFIRGQR